MPKRIMSAKKSHSKMSASQKAISEHLKKVVKQEEEEEEEEEESEEEEE
jgi:hypothetical protein